MITLLLLLGLLAPPSALARIEPPVLRVSAEAEPLSLDWNAVRTPTDRFMASFLMRGLLKYDGGNHLVCDLCKAYKVSADGKTLRFELNEQEQWSDGTKLEAQHFADSFHRLLNAANHFRAAEDFKEVSSFRPDGPAVFEITLARPHSGFLHQLTTAAVYPIRKELLKGAKESGEKHASTAVLGPYQLAAWEHGKRIVIEGNPAYKGERPVYRVDFVLGTHTQLLTKFKAGKLDILSNPTNEDLMKLPGQRLQVNPYWATRDLVFNLRHPKVAELNLRKAVLHALDRDELPAFLRNGERKVTGLIPPGLQGYRELLLATANLPAALKERAQADTDKGSLELTLLLRDQEADRRVAEWLGTELAHIRIHVQPRTVTPAEYAGALEQGRFDLALSTWSFATATPVEVLQSFSTQSSLNRGAWTNVGFDALLGQLIHEPGLKEAGALVDQLTQIVETKEVAVIPLGYPTQPFMLGARVVSFAITPFGDPDLIKIQLKL